MRNQTLLPVLAGYPLSKIKKSVFVPTPNWVSFFYLESGHVMEYIQIGDESHKIVSLFFEPTEFVVRCHPTFSVFESLDDAVTQQFSYSVVIRALHKFPEAHVHYRGLRERYNEKVADRIRSLQTLSWQARYEELAKKQPWVLKMVKLEDIASYVGVSPTLLQNTMKLYS